MIKSDLLKRFNYLSEVLKYSRNLGYLSDGHRTCLHMERSAILQALDVIDFSEEQACTPRYQIPRHLEVICERIENDFNIYYNP